MGKGPLLKAQYNRVRTSTALQGNNMWNNTIGLESNAGGNSAIEASIYAPTIGGGHKAARQERAQGLIDASGFTPTVTTYQGLLDLARQQGATGTATRGACKICGGLGHLTKQCKNGVSGHLASGADLDAPQALAAGLGMLADPNVSDLDSDDLDSSSESGDDADGKRKRKEREREKEKDKERDRKSKKSKKEHKRKKDKKEKKRKSHKESRRGGDDDSGSSDEEARRSKHRKKSSSKKSARDKDRGKDSSGSDSD